MNINIIIPVTVENMAKEIKKITEAYLKGDITLPVAVADLNFLKTRTQDLFMACLTIRWLGKKRLKLVESMLGNIQTLM